VSLPADPSPELADYANPERLVTTAWLAENLTTPGLAIVESNEDVLLYETGHIPGAIKVDWHTELNDPVVRDYVDGAGFANLMSRKGISRDDTVVIYGDKSNWWAAYALWVFTLFGHQDVRLLNGGRDAWVQEGRELTKDLPTREASNYPVVERNDSEIRAFKEDVLQHFGNPLIDVRSPKSTAVSAPTCPLTPRKALSVAATFPQHGACPGLRQQPKMEHSNLIPLLLSSTLRGKESKPPTMSSPTAALASAPVTPGSS